MLSELNHLLENFRMGTPLTYENMTVVPLFFKNRLLLAYSSLSDAVQKEDIEITEVNESGRVPELLLRNKSSKYVLIVDGEQFVGAKQNRIINSSVLIDKKSDTIIDVSCVEQGRWHYKSRTFSDSDYMLDYHTRSEKISDVNRSLRFSKRFVADQGNIWDNVGTFQRKASVNSPTSSMEDVFEKDKLRYVNFNHILAHQKGQNGVVVFINGHPVAIEFISNPKVYQKNHPKIIKSYTSEAIYSSRKFVNPDYIDDAKKLLAEFSLAEESKFKSIGLGEDLRYESDKFLASALVYSGEVIHLVGFTINDRSKQNTGH